MSITFSDHAKYSIKKRRISKKLIIQAVQNPEEILPSFRERKLRRKRVSGKMLEVVTKTGGPQITVITAYYLEE